MLTFLFQGFEPAAKASRNPRLSSAFAHRGLANRLPTPSCSLRAHAAGVGAYAFVHRSYFHAAHVMRHRIGRVDRSGPKSKLIFAPILTL